MEKEKIIKKLDFLMKEFQRFCMKVNDPELEAEFIKTSNLISLIKLELLTEDEQFNSRKVS